MLEYQVKTSGFCIKIFEKPKTISMDIKTFDHFVRKIKWYENLPKKRAYNGSAKQPTLVRMIVSFILINVADSVAARYITPTFVYKLRRNLLWISVDGFAKRNVTVIVLNAPGDLANGCGHEWLDVVSTPAVRVLTRHVSVGNRQHQRQRPKLANHLQTIDS